jgi:hypothetical protein
LRESPQLGVVTDIASSSRYRKQFMIEWGTPKNLDGHGSAKSRCAWLALKLGITMHRGQTRSGGRFIAGVLLATICLAQLEPSGRPDVAKLLAQLRAGGWPDRARAYEGFRSDPTAMRRHEVQRALLDLLDRENQLIESVNRNPAGPSVDQKYGEEYAEYVGRLGEAVDSFADWTDPRQVCIFVHEPYNPESRFAAKIALHGKVAIPCLLQMYRSEVELVRAEAAPLIVQALAKSTDRLDEKMILAAKKVVVLALRDAHEVVRINTIDALGSFGGEDMVPALAEVAQKDPASGAGGDWIRKRASGAIALIEKRVRH